MLKKCFFICYATRPLLRSNIPLGRSLFWFAMRKQIYITTACIQYIWREAIKEVRMICTTFINLPYFLKVPKVKCVFSTKRKPSKINQHFLLGVCFLYCVQFLRSTLAFGKAFTFAWESSQERRGRKKRGSAGAINPILIIICKDFSLESRAWIEW